MPERSPQQILEYKIGRIKTVLANIETPGWIETWPEDRKSRATKLILRQTGPTKYVTLLDMIRPMRKRLEEIILPQYQSKLGELNKINLPAQKKASRMLGVKTQAPLSSTLEEPSTEFMQQIGYDPTRLDDPADVKSFFIRRGFSLEKRKAFQEEYVRIYALWTAGKLPGVLSETEVIEIAATLAGG